MTEILTEQARGATGCWQCCAMRRLWADALRAVGLDPADVHFHDLRHTGNNLAAATGASTKELMARMGHSTMRAALIYQHATRARDRKIADGLSEQIKTARRAPATECSDEANGHAAGTGSASGAGSQCLAGPFALVTCWWRRGESNP